MPCATAQYPTAALARVAAIVVALLLCMGPRFARAQTNFPLQWLYSSIQFPSQVAYSPDGSLLVVGGTSGIQVRSASTGDLLRCLPTAATGGVYSIAFSPDGATLAIGGGGTAGGAPPIIVTGIMELWDLATQQMTESPNLAEFTYVACEAFSPDAMLLVDGGSTSSTSGEERGVLNIWHTATGAPTSSLDPGTTTVDSIGFASSGSLLAVGARTYSGTSRDYTGSIEIWNVATGVEVWSASTGTNTGIVSTALSPDGSSVVAGGQSYNATTKEYSGTLAGWVIANGMPLPPMETSATSVTCLAINPAGTVLADGGAGALELRSFAGGNPKSLSTAATTVNALAFSFSGEMLASGGSAYDGATKTSNGVLELWNPQTNAQIAQLPLALGTTSVYSTAFSADGTLLYAGTDVGLQTFSASTYGLLANYDSGILNQDQVVAVTTSLATNLLGFATSAGSIALSPNPFLTIPISGLSLSPGSVQGGGTATATVTLSKATPSGGYSVPLSSSSASASVPSTVLVGSGATTATFTVTTTGVNAQTKATISAGTGTGSQTATLTITAATLAPLGMNPGTIGGGGTATGTVTLSGPAGPGGTSVTLTSSGSSATVPSSALVSAGANSTTFTVTTSAVDSQTSATITANLNGQSQTATLTITPATLALVSVSPSSVAGGSPSTGTVSLSASAYTGGFLVDLSSSNVDAVVPKSVTVRAGQNTATFSISTKAVPSQKAVTITAKSGTTTKTASLTVTPPGLVSLNVSPGTVYGGLPSTGTITLSGPAPSSGIHVKLASASKTASAPSSVTVASGKTTASFALHTIPVTTQQSVTVTATFDGVSQTAVLRVNPPTVASLKLSPASVKPGGSSTGTVKLTGPAPSGGLVVTISSSSSSVTVPTSVKIPQGATSATFTAKVSKTASAGSVTITATFGVASETATLNVM